MLTQADRAAERRREKLEEIRSQVKDGSLTIRKMTPVDVSPGAEALNPFSR